LPASAVLDLEDVRQGREREIAGRVQLKRIAHPDQPALGHGDDAHFTPGEEQPVVAVAVGRAHVAAFDELASEPALDFLGVLAMRLAFTAAVIE